MTFSLGSGFSRVSGDLSSGGLEVSSGKGSDKGSSTAPAFAQLLAGEIKEVVELSAIESLELWLAQALSFLEKDGEFFDKSSLTVSWDQLKNQDFFDVLQGSERLQGVLQDLDAFFASHEDLDLDKEQFSSLLAALVQDLGSLNSSSSRELASQKVQKLQSPENILGRDVLEFIDLRQKNETAMFSHQAEKFRLHAKEGQNISSLKDLFVESDSQTEGLLLSSSQQGFSGLRLRHEAFDSATARQKLEAALSEWREKMEHSLLEKARVILRDHQQGEIQLKIHPERLGQVRVFLDMNQGQLASARFVVHSEAVQKLFEAQTAQWQRLLAPETGAEISFMLSDRSEGRFYPDSSAFSSSQDQNSSSGSENGLQSEEFIAPFYRQELEVSLSTDIEYLIDMVV